MPTIVAVATPAGNGGIGIVRLSGPGAKNLLSRVFLPRSRHFVNFRPWMLHHGVLLDAEDEPLDDVLAVFMPAPHTYTGEDMAEIHCHGGSFLVSAVVESFERLGARLAGPGEFSKRAYLNGRMDLAQAEAVCELINAPSREAARHGLGRLEGRLSVLANNLRARLDELRRFCTAAVDFPEDEIEGLSEAEFSDRVAQIVAALDHLLSGADRARLMREGARVVLAGAVNAGKSSLFNALAGHDRALVAADPGTTRDFIEAHLNLEGLPVILIDTAGIRESSSDQVEQLGMARSRKLVEDADLMALVVDGQNPGPAGQMAEIMRLRGNAPVVIVWNKSDLGQVQPPEWTQPHPVCHTSAVTGANIDELARTLRTCLLGNGKMAETAIAPNVRQARALAEGRSELALLLAERDAPYDCRLTRLDAAADALATVIGVAAQDEILEQIFSQFCIGK